ncbi:MAG: hypothetical protein K9L66_11275, partial [Spirochaetaceae bacterium]|nr:hypothetical protein [Spirochaetaceae bacterium]MCF7952103.1 hypothetical protein [Spirochaetaceae bacterium]
MDQAIQMADSNDNVRSEPGCTNQGGSAAPVVTRLYVEKLPGLDSEAHTLRQSLRHQLGITALEKVRILQRYDFYHPGPE